MRLHLSISFKLLVACFAAIILFASSNAYAKPYPLSFPIETSHNRTLINIEIDKIPLQFLLDTGSTTTLIFKNERTKNLDLSLATDVMVRFPALKHTTKGKRISGLEIRLDGHIIALQKTLFIEETNNLQDVTDLYDGIIGQEFFHKYVTEIDPYNKVMTLYPAGTKLDKKYRTIHSLKMIDDIPHIIVRSQLPWEPRETRKQLLLDSGYPGGIVLWSKKHFRRVTSQKERDEIGTNNSGVFTRINLRFSQLVFQKLPIFIGSDSPEQQQNRDGIIGSSILAQYKHVIDFRRKKLMLQPIYDENGKPVLMHTGGIYVPNNEKFITKKYTEKTSYYPKLVIYGSQDRAIK